MDRQNPTQGNALHKKYAVVGSDCSGLILNLFRHQNVNMSNAQVVNFKTVLNSTLLNDPIYKSVQAYDLGTIPVNQILSGDIIEWLIPTSKNNHMGIVSIYNGDLLVYQSNGNPNPGDETVQAKNIDTAHGVHPIKLAKMIDPNNSSWGPNYHIIRMHAFGENVQGGVLFYISSDGKTGLVCSSIDQSANLTWDKSYYTTNPVKGQSPVLVADKSVSGTARDVLTGKSNTQKIIATLGSGNYSAYQCSQLTLKRL